MAGNASRFQAFIFSLVFVLVLVVSAPATAATGDRVQEMTYEVYAGGINAVSAEIDMSMTGKNRYSLVLSAFTKGFLGALAPWKGTFETHGWLKKEGLDQPELHRSTATWRDEEEIKEYSFDQKGNFTGYSIRDPENDGAKRVPDPELVQGTTDILTAMLQVMKMVGKGESCEGANEIFDGKRRYKMVFRFEKEEKMIASRYNVYEGPSQRCQVEVQPVAGPWHSKPRGWMSIQEQGRQHGSLPTVWFAKLQENGPAVPVKIMVKSEYGAMFMHLVNYNSGDTIVTAGVMEDITAEEKKKSKAD